VRRPPYTHMSSSEAALMELATYERPSYESPISRFPSKYCIFHMPLFRTFLFAISNFFYVPRP